MDASVIIAIAVGLLALFLAWKIGRFVLKLAFRLIVLTVLAGAVWWFVLR